jgi:hypothetical protein
MRALLAATCVLLLTVINPASAQEPACTPVRVMAFEVASGGEVIEAAAAELAASLVRRAADDSLVCWVPVGAQRRAQDPSDRPVSPRYALMGGLVALGGDSVLVDWRLQRLGSGELVVSGKARVATVDLRDVPDRITESVVEAISKLPPS